MKDKPKTPINKQIKNGRLRLHIAEVSNFYSDHEKTRQNKKRIRKKNQRQTDTISAFLSPLMIPLIYVPPAVECLLNLRFKSLRSVTYFSHCLRLRRPGVRSPDQDIHLAKRCPPTATGILDILPMSKPGLV